MRSDFLRDADRILQRRVTAIEVTGKYSRDPLAERGYRRRDVRRRELLRRLVTVRAHLPDSAPAQDGPAHGGPCLGGRVIGPRRILVLPSIDHVGPSLGLGRPPRFRGEQRGPHSDYRVSRDPAPII